MKNISIALTAFNTEMMDNLGHLFHPFFCRFTFRFEFAERFVALWFSWKSTRIFKENPGERRRETSWDLSHSVPFFSNPRFKIATRYVRESIARDRNSYELSLTTSPRHVDAGDTTGESKILSIVSVQSRSARVAPIRESRTRNL